MQGEGGPRALFWNDKVQRQWVLRPTPLGERVAVLALLEEADYGFCGHKWKWR